MTELDPEARALIDMARPAETSTLADRARIRQRVTATLGLGGAALAAREVLDSGVEASFSPLADPATTGLGVAERVSGEVLRVATGSATKAAGLFGISQSLVLQAAALLVGGALVGGSAWWAWQSVDEPESLPMPSATATETPSDLLPKQRANPPEEHARVPPEEPALVPQPVPLGTADPVQLEDLPVLEPEAERSVPVRRTARAGFRRAAGPQGAKALAAEASGAPARSPKALSLADEARELSAIYQALQGGNPASALARLETLERHPGGALTEERLVARVLSLCGLGRVEEAETLARRVQNVAPESPLLPRLSGSCARGVMRSPP